MSSDSPTADRRRAYDLHRTHLNPAFVQMLRAIGFDKGYVRGEGCHLWDADGRRYLDLLTGWGVFALGRSHPRLKAALQERLDADGPNLAGMDCSRLSGELARRLARFAGGDLSRVYFCNSGAESVEAAIKFARCATSREEIVYCENAYHGLTLGALALCGQDVFRERFGPPMPGGRRIPAGDLAALEAELAHGKAAAFVVEPVQGETCAVAPDGYLAEAGRLCRKAGTLLVVDEVQSGLGRTGRFFAYQHWPEVEPDVVCVAKALSGGYVPVGATITRPRIMDAVFDSMDHCTIHSSTFGENDLAMAAGLATLDVLEDERLVENAAAMGDYAMARLREIAGECPFVSGIRGKGLMLGIAFARPAESLTLKVAWDALHAIRPGLFGQMVVIPLLEKHRILAQVAGYQTPLVKLLPPLTIGPAEIDLVVDAMRDVLADTLRVPGAAWETVTGLARRALRSP